MLQIVLAVYAFIYTDELANAAQNGFQKLWDDMLNGDQKSTEAIHGIQRGLQCCGVNSAVDWTTNGRDVPTSCCVEGVNSCNPVTSFSSGCGKLLHGAVSGSGMLIAWIAIVFAAFEVKY